MKNVTVRSLLFFILFSAGVAGNSCKDKKDSTTTTDQNDANYQSPEIASDAALERGVQDAVKDHPGVTATVKNGEISLSGTIERDKWINLKQTLDGLNPRKVNSEQLTVK